MTVRALFLFAVVVSVIGEASRPFALLKDVKTLTMYKGKMTNSGRSAPVKQINCVGGDACQHYTPEVFNCVNMGTDDRGEVQWKCQAHLENYYRLGQTQVSCEGYTSSEDPYILSGSCGVEYTLHLTKHGKKHHSPKPRAPSIEELQRQRLQKERADEIHRENLRQQKHQQKVHDEWHRKEKARQSTMDVIGATVVALLLGCLVSLCCCCLCCCPDHNHNRPHVVNHPAPPANYGYNLGPPVARGVAPPVCTTHHHHSSSGPGFLTGYMMGGAGLSHGHTTNVHTTQNVAAAAPPPRPRSPEPASSSGGGWGDWGSSSSSSSSSYSAPSSSGSTYASTGFGGTKKR